MNDRKAAEGKKPGKISKNIAHLQLKMKQKPASIDRDKAQEYAERFSLGMNQIFELYAEYDGLIEMGRAKKDKEETEFSMKDDKNLIKLQYQEKNLGE